MSTRIHFPVPTARRSAYIAIEGVAELRERRTREEEERAESRRINLAELHSDLICAELRICAWEKMHGLHMPSGGEHPVLHAIAAATQLTLEEIHDEQRMRSSRSLPCPR